MPAIRIYNFHFVYKIIDFPELPTQMRKLLMGGIEGEGKVLFPSKTKLSSKVIY